MNATQQKFKPILFSTEMVQAILAGRKTQTRRVIKIKSTPFSENFTEAKWKNHLNSAGAKLLYGGFEKGDILWVRETWIKSEYATNLFYYKTDKGVSGNWKPSIYMPKEAARIFLKVTNVRVERLQDISEEDTKAEGIERDKNGFMPTPDKFWAVDGSALFNSAKLAFIHLWQKINAKKHPWESNPWVWVYTFERIEKPENFLS